MTRKTACREKQTHLKIGFSEHTLKKRHRIESGRYSWKHDRQEGRPKCDPEKPGKRVF